MGLASKNLKPKLDFSWVPKELRSFAAGTLGTMLIVLVAVFVVLCLAVAWHKLTATDGGKTWLMLAGTVAAAALVVSLPKGMDWANKNINPVPGGITSAVSLTVPGHGGDLKT